MNHSRLLVMTLALGLAGCASAPAGEPGQTRDARRITSEEIRAGEQSNAFNLVQRLRPTWLRVRGPTTLQGGGNPIMVYVDGQRLGPLEQLRNISTTDIESMRFLDSGEATARFGTGHVNGAIVVTSRRGG